MSAEILIIDDNPDIRNIIRDLINETGYKTRVAANYNQALKEIDKKLPDVAIIDVKLDKGDNDGIELLSHIKKKNKGVIFLDGDMMREFLEIDNNNKQLSKKITVLVDGEKIELDPHEPLILKKGQSVTVERNIFHRFYSVKGSGMVMAGEVSQVNDDNNDNYFLEQVGRFSQIQEDEPPLHPLWNEV